MTDSRYMEFNKVQAIGVQVAEQLPNLTGSFDLGDRRTHIDNPVGVFYKKTDAPSSIWGAQSSASGNTFGVGFNASRFSSIYTDNGHVKPKALSLVAIIKY